MARYHRRRRKYGDKFTREQKQKYWDEKVLAEPDKLPQNFDYYVPKVPTMKDGPSLEDVGLTNDIHEVVVFYRDEKAKPPESFDPKVGENLIRLIFTAGTTATALSVIVAAGSSSRRSNLILELLALGVGAYGGSYSLWIFWLLISTPIKATIAKIHFQRLAPDSGNSPLLGGKSLNEVELILRHRDEFIANAKVEHQSRCDARVAEIWRRHRLRIERIKANAELARLKEESQQKADMFESSNFPTLAMNPGYWTDGSVQVKGKELERKFAFLLQSAGYKTRLTREVGDDGIDIIATKEDEHIVVQCKNYIARVGASEIRDFAGALKFVKEKAPNAVGWLVAPNGFSERTHKKFHRPGDLELWEFSDMQEFVIETFKHLRDTSDEDLGAIQ